MALSRTGLRLDITDKVIVVFDVVEDALLGGGDAATELPGPLHPLTVLQA